MNARDAETKVKFWRQRRVVLGGAAALLLTLMLTAALWVLAPVFAGPALTILVVSGRLAHVEPATVRATVQPLIGKGFFTTDVDTLSAAVVQLPWVAEANVRRQWPHTLSVDIVEETPVARWGTDGLMDARGRVFAKSRDAAYAKLPHLSGGEGSEQDVLAQYNTLTGLLAPRGLAIAVLAVDIRGAATLELDDGIEVRLGREQAEQRLARFGAEALPALGARLTSVAYVDMRYSNGFAVGWRAASAASGARSGGV
jgi:cell division protein FtsQ